MGPIQGVRPLFWARARDTGGPYGLALMSAAHPSFLLVDDHALFRTGLAMMLSQAWPEAQVRQAGLWAEGLRALQADCPDMILLDVHLPDGHGVADLPALKALAPHCPVLLMSAECDAAQIQQARESGAIGFLPKAASANEVMGAVRSALAGQSAFAAVPYGALGSARPEPSQPAWQVNEAPPSLSARQIDILGYLGRGTPNKAIARKLGLSEPEVRAEVSWLTEWLNASSREEAHAQALARGLLTP
jgi:two-component system nitrate/nitrite response regulator NarL